MTVIKKDNNEYTIPEKKIIKVLSTQIRTPQATGSTFISRILIIINGIANIANFFQILNTFSEKIKLNKSVAEIKRGVNIKKT